MTDFQWHISKLRHGAQLCHDGGRTRLGQAEPAVEDLNRVLVCCDPVCFRVGMALSRLTARSGVNATVTAAAH